MKTNKHILILLLTLAFNRVLAQTYDVVVYGGTSAGVIAASEPPAMIILALPSRMVSKALIRAVFEDARAVRDRIQLDHDVNFTYPEIHTS